MRREAKVREGEEGKLRFSNPKPDSRRPATPYSHFLHPSHLSHARTHTYTHKKKKLSCKADLLW
jgi:hypothetical protein